MDNIRQIKQEIPGLLENKFGNENQNAIDTAGIVMSGYNTFDKNASVPAFGSDNYQCTKPEDFKWRKSKDNKGVIIDDYIGKDTHINFPSRIMGLPVIEIKQLRNDKITSVVFPDSITEIETHMLGFCGAVKNITIGNNVKIIGTYAFQNNRQLTQVIIPGSVLKIERGAFENCGLEKVTIGKGVTYIGTNAFSANNLTEVEIPDSVIFLGVKAFFKNKLKHITIPKGIAFISQSAFADNALTSAALPDDLISIENGAFMNNQLTGVTIPESVKSIRESAFEENQIKSVILPDRLTYLGQRAFCNNKIKSVMCPKNPAFLFKGADSGGSWIDKTGPFDSGVEIIKLEESVERVYPSVNPLVYPPKPESLINLDNDFNRSVMASNAAVKKPANIERTPSKDEIIAAYNFFNLNSNTSEESGRCLFTVKEIKPAGNWKWELEAENNESLAVIIGWAGMEDADKAEEIYKSAPGIMFHRAGSATAYIRTSLETGSVKDILTPFLEAGRDGKFDPKVIIEYTHT